MIIYKATNITNNKCYIGQTVKSLDVRIRAHLSYAKNTNNNGYFQRAIRKYQWYSFAWEVLERCDSREELNEMEYHYIKSFQAYGKGGYNLTWGGAGVPKEEEDIIKTPNKSIISHSSPKRNKIIDKPSFNSIEDYLSKAGTSKWANIPVDENIPVVPVKINLSGYFGVFSVNDISKEFNISLSEAADIISTEIIKRQRGYRL